MVYQLPVFVNLPIQNNIRYARLVSLDLPCDIILTNIWDMKADRVQLSKLIDFNYQS